MKRLYRCLFSVGLLGVVLAAVTVTALVFPVMAAPNRQDDANLPTPTPFPVDKTPYTLETVGGVNEMLVFSGSSSGNLVINTMTVTSEYPRGMTFTVKAQSSGGDIQDAILFIRYVHGSGTRVTAEFDSEQGVWVARPWAAGDEQPAWTHFDFYWRIRDTTGASVDTEAHTVDYWDPTRPWFRMESEHVILYWFGFGEDDPDLIAQTMADAMASTHQRRVDGFGGPLSYKPIAVVYPSREALAETSGSGVERNRVAGFTSSDLGMSVQILRDASLVPGNENCIWALKPEEWTMERRINTIYTTTTHEVVHLYQYEKLGGAMGPEWWSEGEAEWFSLAPGLYDRRLRHLATLQDIPSLLTGVGSDLTQADGCYALSYDVGPSFINYLLANYGGIETHRRIVETNRGSGTLYEAIEQVTGKPFLEIENEWRAYLGYRPLTLAEVDPASALEPVEDPLFAEGDTVILPMTPPLSPIYEKPGPRALASGQCFAGMQVKILKIGALEGVTYFQVDCMGQIGWMTREQLAGPQ